MIYSSPSLPHGETSKVAPFSRQRIKLAHHGDYLLPDMIRDAPNLMLLWCHFRVEFGANQEEK
jgi:hypothetical protein